MHPYPYKNTVFFQIFSHAICFCWYRYATMSRYFPVKLAWTAYRYTVLYRCPVNFFYLHCNFIGTGIFFFQVEKNKISYSRQPFTSNTDTTSDSTSGKAFLIFIANRPIFIFNILPVPGTVPLNQSAYFMRGKKLRYGIFLGVYRRWEKMLGHTCIRAGKIF